MGLLSHPATLRGPGLPPKHPLPVALGHRHQLGAEFGVKSPQSSITSPPHPVCLPATGRGAQPGCLGPSASVPPRLCPESLQYSRTRVNMYRPRPSSMQSLRLAEGRHEARRLLSPLINSCHTALHGAAPGARTRWAGGRHPGSPCQRRSRAAGLTRGEPSGRADAQGKEALPGGQDRAGSRLAQGCLDSAAVVSTAPPGT